VNNSSPVQNDMQAIKNISKFVLTGARQIIINKAANP
jgi:hypothetical protein